MFVIIPFFFLSFFKNTFKKNQQQLQHNDDMAVLNLMIVLQIGISMMFPYCYFGKIATDSYLDMSYCLYDLNWPDLPLEYKKYIILMMTNMNREIYYHGSNVATLNSSTYIRVCMF